MNAYRRLTTANDVIDIMVSVVIPVYNRVVELERAVRSVLGQSWQAFEILVVDDGSEVDIKTACDLFKDDRIRYFRNSDHTNANVARNKGIKEAKGAYIAMLDSDDEFLPLHLERRLRKIREWGCDGIFGSAYVIEDEQKKILQSRPLREGERIINYLLSDGFAPTPSHFYKTSSARAVLWDEMLERHQDLDFMVRFSERFTLGVDPIPTIVVHWEYHAGKDFKLDSCMAFIERNKDFIDRKIYCDYHRNMYSKIYKYEKPQYVEHYAAESCRYIECVSFRSYYHVHKNSRRPLIYLVLKYLSLLLSAYLHRWHCV